MKKFVVILILLLIILVTFTFVILRVLANGPENNFFNSKNRERLAKNETLREIIGLHYDGDARTDYLGTKYSKILVEVDEMAGLNIPDTSLDLLKDKIADATGKEVEFVVTPNVIPYTDYLTEEQIKNLVTIYRNYMNTKDTATVYILYLSQQGNEQDRLGVTYQEYGVILFDAPLRLFTQTNPDTMPAYIESTALHEFGHQLGLPHNNFSDCLMQGEADHPFGGIETVESVITDFCNYEKDLINAQKVKVSS